MATNYTIQEGDTLSDLALKHGTTVEKIMADNPQITDPDKIYEGYGLTLPAKTDIGINATDIKETADIDVGGLPVADTKSVENLVNATTGLPEYYQKQYEESLKKEEEAKKLQTELGEKPEADVYTKRGELETGYGVQDLKSKTQEQSIKVAKLQGEIDKINILQLQEIDRIRSQTANVPTYIIDRQENQINREFASQKAYKAVEMGQEALLLQAYSGNLTEARNMVKDIVDAYVFDITQKRADYDKLYDRYSDWIDSLDKDQRDILDTARAEIITQEENTKKDKLQVMEWMLKYPSAGISVKDSLDEASQKATTYAATHPEELKLSDSLKEGLASELQQIVNYTSREEAQADFEKLKDSYLVLYGKEGVARIQAAINKLPLASATTTQKTSALTSVKNWISGQIQEIKTTFGGMKLPQIKIPEIKTPTKEQQYETYKTGVETIFGTTEEMGGSQSFLNRLFGA